MSIARRSSEIALSILVLAFPVACNKTDSEALKPDRVAPAETATATAQQRRSADVQADAPVADPQPRAMDAVDGASSTAQGNDGLPLEIPQPSSPPPTVAEWEAVPREITVRGSSALNCETKMVREWLRVSCRPRGGFRATALRQVESSGQQIFSGMFGDRASLVVQIVRGKNVVVDFDFNDGRTMRLVANWPSGAPRPIPFGFAPVS